VRCIYFRIFEILTLFSLQKFLIIRFSSIGDIVLTTPVVRCIKLQFPEAEIHFLTKEKFYPVLKANPYITKVHTFQDDMGPLIGSLKDQDFDFIVDLHKNLRSARVKIALRKASGTFSKLNLQKWLLVNLKINRLPALHIVDRYFHAVEKLGIKNDNQGLDYFIPEDDNLGHDDLPQYFHEEFIAFVIGGLHHTKMFPEERIIELCQMIDKPIILLGGPDDREKAERIIAACDNEIMNGCGQFSINQSAAIIKMSSKVITNDTGLMHIAAAFRKEIISFWGNTIPAFGMFPYLPTGEGSSDIFEVKDLPCRPCSKIGYDKCPKKHFKCMMDIELKAVLDKVKT